MFAAFAALVLAAAPQEPAVARALGWEDFPVFVWRETHRGKPLPPELADPFGGVILMRDEDSAWARERGLAYMVWNVAGRELFHLDADEAWRARVERWIETKDDALLVRTPCLSDPATYDRAFQTLDATLAKHGEHPGLAFVLGDEVGRTPNGSPFDLCRCGRCEERWRAYAQALKLPDRAPLTDEVLAALRDDDFTLLGAWLARRRFDRLEFEHALLRVRERALGFPDPGFLAPIAVRKYSSSASVRGRPLLALLGLKGPTAFGGLGAPPGLFAAVEFYSVGEGRETLAASTHLGVHLVPGGTGRSEETLASLTTVFVADETPDGAAWTLWEHWLRGGHGAVLWSDSELARRPEHRARLAEAVSELRALEGLFAGLEQNGGAIVYDHDSVAASFLRDARDDGATWPRRSAGYQAEHGTRERKVETWLRLLEDCGELPAAVPLQSLREDCGREYHVLVLPEILVLDPSDVDTLRAVVAAGGTLVIDGRIGWVDRKGKPWSEDVFARLAAGHPERVLRAPESLARYLDNRLDAEAAAATRSFARGLFASRPSSGEAVLPPLDPSVPWLVNQSFVGSTPEGGTVPYCVLMPNLSTREDRRRLRDLPLPVLAPGEGEWIHPKGGGTLRAGDAAMLRPGRFRPR
ncbi:MAG: hypothetical protein ABL998_02680 [Planctomycetota bacterium]